MSTVLAISLGGAIGTAVRYLTTALAARWLGSELPYGTLAVNLGGAFVIGLVQEVATATLLMPETVRAFLVIGILGGMTTYSAFAYDTVRLMSLGAWGKALVYVLATNLLCFALCWLGVAAARVLVGGSS